MAGSLPHRERRAGECGLTLVELLVAIAILGVLSTMLIATWISLQGASALVVRSTSARATARDATSRVAAELRGCQPTVLPSAAPTATSQPPLTMATRNDVRFYSSFNSAATNRDGSGVTALRPTRLWLDTTDLSDQKKLYWQRDMDENGSFTDAGDRTMLLASDVVNELVPDSVNGTGYTPLFRYAYRDSDGEIRWTDDADSLLASVVAIRIRLIIDANMAHAPNPVDVTTTVRLRNASGD